VLDEHEEEHQRKHKTQTLGSGSSVNARQAIPTVAAERSQRQQVVLIDRIGRRNVRKRAFDAVFPEYVQDRIR